MPSNHARSARDLIESYFGLQIPVIARESTVTVGTSPVAVGSYARQRVAIGFGNSQTNNIVVGFSPSLTLGGGYPVPQNGFLSFIWFDDGELVMLDMYAIAAVGAQSLYVCETVLMGV